MPAKSPSFLELAHLVISLLCGNKPVSYSYKLVYQSTLLVGTMGDSRAGGGAGVGAPPPPKKTNKY